MPKNKQQAKKQDNDNSKSFPEVKFSVPPGLITATVWRNEARSQNGPFTYRAVQFQRRYQDKDGEWKNSSSIFEDELPKAIAVLIKAYAYLLFHAPREPRKGGQDGQP